MPSMKITRISFRKNANRRDGVKAIFDIEFEGQPIKWCRYVADPDGRRYVLGPSMRYVDGREGYFAPVPFTPEIGRQLLVLYHEAERKKIGDAKAAVQDAVGDETHASL